MTDIRESLARIKARLDARMYVVHHGDEREWRTAVTASQADVPRLTEALEAVLNELDRCDDGIKIEYVHRGRRARTPDDNAVERIQAVRSAEREAARRIRAAITNALTEEDA